MKKLLSTLLALTLVASLASCGDSKDSSSEKSSTSSSSSDSSDDNEEETEEEIEETSLGAEESAAAFKEIAGTYYANGYMTEGKKPEKFEDIKEYEDKVNEEGITISEDGILSIEGEEYQLLAQKNEKDSKIFSVKGCGFSVDKYNKGKNAAYKNYDGFAVLESKVQYMEVNGEKQEAYTDINLRYSPKGKTSALISISLDTKKPKKNYQDPLTDEEKAEFLKKLSGTYSFSYGMNNSTKHSLEKFEDPSSDEVKQLFEDDPVTISDSGVLHFDGKDYQLEPQEYDAEEGEGILSVEGCGFSLKEYKKGIGLDVASKDYAGAALVSYSESYFTFNDVKTITPQITIYLTDGKSGSACVSFNFNGEQK